MFSPYVTTHRLNAQFHSLSVEFNGLVCIFLLILFKSLCHQKVRPLQIQLLLTLQRVTALCLNWSEIQSVNWGVPTDIGLTGIVHPKISAFIYSTSCCYKPMWLPFCTRTLKQNSKGEITVCRSFQSNYNEWRLKLANFKKYSKAQ